MGLVQLRHTAVLQQITVYLDGQAVGSVQRLKLSSLLTDIVILVMDLKITVQIVYFE